MPWLYHSLMGILKFEDLTFFVLKAYFAGLKDINTHLKHILKCLFKATLTINILKIKVFTHFQNL